MGARRRHICDPVDPGQGRQVRPASQGQAGLRKIIRKIAADVATLGRTIQLITNLDVRSGCAAEDLNPRQVRWDRSWLVVADRETSHCEPAPAQRDNRPVVEVVDRGRQVRDEQLGVGIRS